MHCPAKVMADLEGVLNTQQVPLSAHTGGPATHTDKHTHNPLYPTPGMFSCSQTSELPDDPGELLQYDLQAVQHTTPQQGAPQQDKAPDMSGLQTPTQLCNSWQERNWRSCRRQGRTPNKLTCLGCRCSCQDHHSVIAQHISNTPAMKKG